MDMFHTRQRHLSRYRRHGDATDEMISIDTDALRLSYAQDDSSSLEVIHWFVFLKWLWEKNYTDKTEQDNFR